MEGEEMPCPSGHQAGPAAPGPGPCGGRRGLNIAGRTPGFFGDGSPAVGAHKWGSTWGTPVLPSAVPQGRGQAVRGTPATWWPLCAWSRGPPRAQGVRPRGRRRDGKEGTRAGAGVALPLGGLRPGELDGGGQQQAERGAPHGRADDRGPRCSGLRPAWAPRRCPRVPARPGGRRAPRCPRSRPGSRANVNVPFVPAGGGAPRTRPLPRAGGDPRAWPGILTGYGAPPPPPSK
jgi:hypothetical protein